MSDRGVKDVDRAFNLLLDWFAKLKRGGLSPALFNEGCLREAASLRRLRFWVFARGDLPVPIYIAGLIKLASLQNTLTES
jgi:hypothetical protein